MSTSTSPAPIPPLRLSIDPSGDSLNRRYAGAGVTLQPGCGWAAAGGRRKGSRPAHTWVFAGQARLAAACGRCGGAAYLGGEQPEYGRWGADGLRPQANASAAASVAPGSALMLHPLSERAGWRAVG